MHPLNHAHSILHIQSDDGDVWGLTFHVLGRFNTIHLRPTDVHHDASRPLQERTTHDWSWQLDTDQPTVSIASLIEREYSAQVMFDRTDTCIARTRSWGIRTVVILFLCLAVLVQMLGVPPTLLSPALSLDTLGESVLEGFSIPPTVPLVTLSSKTACVLDAHPSVHVPILASAVFHPPLL